MGINVVLTFFKGNLKVERTNNKFAFYTDMISMQKKNHHIIPKLYLKGFLSKEELNHIWVYSSENVEFLPGKFYGKNNPLLLSYKKAGAIEGAYAVEKNGRIEYNRYENMLEKLEKPHDKLLLKLRNREILNQNEKKLFAHYIMMMLRRVENRIGNSMEIWAEVLEEENKNFLNVLNHIIATSKDEQTKLEYLEIKKNVEKIFQKFDSNIPDKSILLEALNHPMRDATRALYSMNWQLFISSDKFPFVTCDNPVFFHKSLGFKNEMCELSFPISSKIALVASWHNINETIIQASETDVKEINHRTIVNASKEVFASYSSKSLVNFIKRNRKRPISLIY